MFGLKRDATSAGIDGPQRGMQAAALALNETETDGRAMLVRYERATPAA